MSMTLGISKYEARKMEQNGCPNCGTRVVKGEVIQYECMGCRRKFEILTTPLDEEQAIRAILSDGTDKDLAGNGEEAITIMLKKVMYFCLREELTFSPIFENAQKQFEQEIVDAAAAAEKARQEEEARQFFLKLANGDASKDSVVVLMHLMQGALEAQELQVEFEAECLQAA
jgi:hypothetical protein